MKKRQIQLRVIWLFLVGLFLFSTYLYTKIDQRAPSSLLVWTPRTADSVRYSNAYDRLHDLFYESTEGWSRFEITGGWRDDRDRDITEPGYFYLVNIESLDSDLITFKSSIDAILTAPEDHDRVSQQGFEQQESFIQLLDMHGIE